MWAWALAMTIGHGRITRQPAPFRNLKTPAAVAARRDGMCPAARSIPSLLS
jgi:hypothetical protein